MLCSQIKRVPRLHGWKETHTKQPSPDLVQLEVGGWGKERLREGEVERIYIYIYDKLVIYIYYKLQREKEHDSNKRSRTRIASTVISKLKKKEKESELHCTSQQYWTLDDNINKKMWVVYIQGNYRCEGRRRHSLIFKVSKKFDLTSILSQEALGAYVLPKQGRNKQRKRKTWTQMTPETQWAQDASE